MKTGTAPVMLRLVLSVGVALTAAWAGRAEAQELGLRPTVSPAAPIPPSPSECEGRASQYGAGGIRVWVVRQGIVEQDNPLRPLTRDRLTVLQVVVNGRSATAFGPDLQNMRQGGAPARLQEEIGQPIHWLSGSPPPDAFRIVAEDGRVLLGPLAFEGCGEAPAVAAEKPAPAKTRQGGAENPPPATRSAPSGAGGNRPGLPQGAIPSGGRGGLSLPQP